MGSRAANRAWAKARRKPARSANSSVITFHRNHHRYLHPSQKNCSVVGGTLLLVFCLSGLQGRADMCTCKCMCLYVGMCVHACVGEENGW